MFKLILYYNILAPPFLKGGFIDHQIQFQEEVS
jgi:hypothetical protein